MFNISYKKMAIILAVGLILGFGSYASADWEGGYGHHGYGHHGYGMGPGMGYGPGCDYGDDLTPEEFAAFQKERKAFDKDTLKLRQNIYQKQLALRSELAKTDPDAKKALQIQKEISGLRAEIDQKRIEYLIKIRKIAPMAGLGRMQGYGYGQRGPCGR